MGMFGNNQDGRPNKVIANYDWSDKLNVAARLQYAGKRN